MRSAGCTLTVRHHSNALVKITLLFFAVVLLATACRQHKDSADETMQKQLAGTWTWEAKYAGGVDSEHTITVNPNGSYALTINIPTRTNGPRTVNIEGTFHVEDGFLVDTMTKHSETNAPVPSTNRARIVRLDGREMALDYEKLPGSAYPTNQLIYLKQTN
jgi:hypothetical protein